MLADEVDYVVGVDTHRDQHVLAIVVAPTGAVIAQTIGRPPSARGYADARALRRSSTRPALESGRSRAPATTAPGSPVTCSARGETVHEVDRTSPRRAAAARQGRPARRDPRRALGARDTSIAALPRSGEHQEALRRAVARPAQRRRRPPSRARPTPQRDRHRTRAAPRRAATAASRRAAPPLQPLPPLQLAHTRPARDDPRPALARPPHPGSHRTRPTTLEREILSHVRALVPELLDEPGVGPIVAAQLIVTWSHHDRVHSEAAFARLAGVAPLPASSGQTTRHRLSRGGDRQLNRALHTVILHRRQHDPATRDYIARRVAEGKTSRDATRLLKRYLARHLYRVMQNRPH